MLASYRESPPAAFGVVLFCPSALACLRNQAEIRVYQWQCSGPYWRGCS